MTTDLLDGTTAMALTIAIGVAAYTGGGLWAGFVALNAAILFWLGIERITRVIRETRR